MLHSCVLHCLSLVIRRCRATAPKDDRQSAKYHAVWRMLSRVSALMGASPSMQRILARSPSEAELPRDVVRVWPRDRLLACGTTSGHEDVEVECDLPAGGTIRLHRKCYDLVSRAAGCDLSTRGAI